MGQIKDTTKSRKGKHLNYEERIKIEALYKLGLTPTCIGKQINDRSRRTVERELDVGAVKLLNSDLTTYTSYSADVAQEERDSRSSNKGPSLKIGNDHELAAYLEKTIGSTDEKLSPYGAIQNISNKNLKFKTSICSKTVYNYLDKDLFLNISNKDLMVKKNGKKRGYNKVRQALNNVRGTSISERPESIDTRDDVGHWEMDTVVGKQGTKTVLLVLSERTLRKELIFKIKSKSQKDVIHALDKLERKLGCGIFLKTFKTITCDNGCENLDFAGIEKSAINKCPRTKVYYAHPYSSWERGTNENINKMIRRFIPKGVDISAFSHKEIERIQNWINNYPRRILGGLSANMAEEMHCAA